MMKDSDVKLIRYFRFGLRSFIVFCFDLATIGLALFGAFLIRFDFNIPAEDLELLKRAIIPVYVIQSLVFVFHGLYRGMWAFASIRDLFLIARSVLFSVLFCIVVVHLGGGTFPGWPRSIFLLDGFLLILMLGGGRFTYRIGRETFLRGNRQSKRILIVGAGRTGDLIAREIASGAVQARLVGFLDDKTEFRGRRLHNAPVLGKVSDIEGIIHKTKPDEIVIAIPSLRGDRVKAILSAASAKGVSCRICPPIRDVLSGRAHLSNLRSVGVEDLLRRDTVTVDDTGLSEFLGGRRVLITGAGGSIGSELCRQVLRYQPQCLVLFDQSEFNLYRIERELSALNEQAQLRTRLVFILGDVLDASRLLSAFSEHSPEVVLHAAAYKHVPLVEENIAEAIKNNVLGTSRVVNAAADAGSAVFVLVSTDKSVRPTSVMGATKRMAEMVTYTVGQQRGIRTLAVRFGNVLDSEGSVLPLFREQIARGGPVTVTHPEVTRYFMTIPEASSLVIQAAILGQGGEVFLLEMGEPVLIRSLAEDLISLSGLRPYKDIEIVFTGLRKGEKLYEELLTDLSQATRTAHPKIFVSRTELSGAPPSHWQEWLEEVSSAPMTRAHIPLLLENIKAWVPDFKMSEAETEGKPSLGSTGRAESLYRH